MRFDSVGSVNGSTSQVYDHGGKTSDKLRFEIILKESSSSFHRLLDVFHTTSPSRQETHLSLVFEHIEQDLSVYLENCPQPGLPEWKIKVAAY